MAPTIMRIAASVSSVLLAPSGAGHREQLIIESEVGSADLYVSYGAPASLTSYSAVLHGGDTLIEDEYENEVYGIWASAAGHVQVTSSPS